VRSGCDERGAPGLCAAGTDGQICRCVLEPGSPLVATRRSSGARSDPHPLARDSIIRHLKTALTALAAALILVLIVVAARTATFRTAPVAAPRVPEEALRPGYAERLAAAVQLPTVSGEDPAGIDPRPFLALHRQLEEDFPATHAALRREVIGGLSLLFTWPGSDPALQPILLMGHTDVVPVEPGTEEQWTHRPFSGAIAQGYVWGRGTTDDKPTVLGTLEAVEMLLNEGFQPRRTVLLAFGHDEEVGGSEGARAIATLLRERGVRLAMVLDEGGVIGDGLLPGLRPPTALVGVAEKGYASVELIARASGGHSSMPPPSTAIGTLAAAITRLEERQMPARLDGASRDLFLNIGPELPLAQRAAFANLWLTRPLVLRQLAGTPSSNAMVRTTSAATLVQGGTRDNVLPGRASAVVNFRILPGDSVEGVLNHVRAVVGGDGVTVRLAGEAWNPSPVSPHDGPEFAAIERTIRGLVPNALVTPYLVLGATDARHYAGLTDNVFRFLPIRMDPAALERIHGTNERIAVEDYALAIRFYRRLIREMAGEAGGCGG
jgi:carboxypeptidase PM20D1